MSARIRLADPADAAACQAIYAPIVRDTIISFELEPPTVDEMAARIRTTLPTHPWLVCETAGVLSGYAYAGPHRTRAAYGWAADVSVYVDGARRRSGVGRALYAALLDVLPLQNVHAAFAGITLPNPASVGLHEALGFTPVGVYHRVGWKLGAWHDVGWWERELRPRTAAPEPVRPLGAVAGTEAWVDALTRAAAALPPDAGTPGVSAPPHGR